MAETTRAAEMDNRGVVGSAVMRRRLSAEAKQEIVAQCSEGVAQLEIAMRYCVTESCVSKIMRKSRI